MCYVFFECLLFNVIILIVVKFVTAAIILYIFLNMFITV